VKVLVAHTRYRQRGGEDAVADHEVDLLRGEGCSVDTLLPKSVEFDTLPLLVRLGAGLNAGDHRYGRALIRMAFEKSGIPDVVHFHNLFPMLGFGAVKEAGRCGCATVVTLHNYRLSCLAGSHLWAGAPCERCSPGHYGPGVARACYRGSRLQSAALSRGLARYWEGLRSPRSRTVVLCLTEFMRERLVSRGLPTEAVVVKPNSVSDFGCNPDVSAHNGALFIGRLTPEKGALDLVRHWPASAPSLTLAGDGRDLDPVRREAGPNVHVLGAVSPETVRELLATSRVLMLPSLGSEGGLPRVVLEAFAAGVPCAAFDVNSTRSALENAAAGVLSKPADFDVLAAAGMAVCIESDADWQLRSRMARTRYEAQYTDERNARGLVEAYGFAIRLKKER